MKHRNQVEQKLYVVVIDETYILGSPRTLLDARSTAFVYGGEVYKLTKVKGKIKGRGGDAGEQLDEVHTHG